MPSLHAASSCCKPPMVQRPLCFIFIFGATDAAMAHRGVRLLFEPPSPWAHDRGVVSISTSAAASTCS